MGAFSIRLKRDLGELQRLADGVAAFAGREGLDESALAVLLLVIDEIVSNVVTHAARSHPDDFIDVRVLIGPHRILARIEDEGPPFDPTTSSPVQDIDSPAPDRPIGGLGLLIVGAQADRFIYRRRDGRNIVAVVKRRTPGTPG